MGQSSLVDLNNSSMPLALLAVRHRIPQVPLLALGRALPRFPRLIGPGPHLRRAVVAHHVFSGNSQRDGPVRLDPFQLSRDAVPPPPAGLGAVLLELEPDGRRWGLGVCILLDDVDEPLLDDDELPDDDDDDDDVLSSSLSTSRFLRGLSLTPPRRGLSLMPRLSIVYVGRRRMVGMGIGAVRLSCPSWLSRRRCRAVQGSTSGAGAVGSARGSTDGLLSRRLPSAGTVFSGCRTALTSCANC